MSILRIILIAATFLGLSSGFASAYPRGRDVSFPLGPSDTDFVFYCMRFNGLDIACRSQPYCTFDWASKVCWSIAPHQQTGGNLAISCDPKLTKLECQRSLGCIYSERTARCRETRNGLSFDD